MLGFPGLGKPWHSSARHFGMADYNRDPGLESRATNWIRSNKISMWALIFAALALLVSLIQPVSSLTHYLNRPRVAIKFPANGANEPNNTFGSSGIASNIPTSSDLWLVVRSGVEGRYYPVDNLTLANNKWSIPGDWICPASGRQDIQIYLVPNTDENDLFDYTRGRGPHHGINSMPSQAVLEASHAIKVAANSQKSC
jgi:hypothetical protein